MAPKLTITGAIFYQSMRIEPESIDKFAPMRVLLRMTGSILSGFFVALLCLSANAQTRKYSNEFLNIGVGARALGMSGANVASVNDATAGYWNPAGMTDIEADLEVAFMHASYFAGIANYDYGAIAKPLDTASVITLGFVRFGVDDIPNTTQLIDAGGNFNYDRITTFSAVDYAFMLGYARKLKITGLSLGANVKVVHRVIGSFARSWGFGIDLGATYRLKNWRFALVGRDLTSTYNAWSYSLDEATRDVFVATGNELPENGLEITLPRIVLGAAYTARLNRISLTGEVNASVSTDGRRNTVISGDPFSVDPLMGFEAGYQNIVFLRAGLGNIQKVKTFRNTEEYTLQPNIGLGLRLGNFYLDYALTDIGDLSDALYSNVFSVRFQVFKKEGP